MFNTYQNRVATARESYNNAVLNYNNAIKDARLQNNSVLAEIAYEALQKQLELSLHGFQYKNQLLLDKANKKTEINNTYYQRYQDVLDQINHENALAEQVRQYNESQALKERQLQEEIRQFNAQLAEEQRQFNATMAARNSGGGGGGGGSSKGSSSSSKTSSSGAKIIKSSGSSNKGVTVDTKSVINLGYGPISGENLASKVKSGEVTATQNGNKLVFTNNTNQSKKFIETSKYFSTR